jgi:hypothetical protein
VDLLRWMAWTFARFVAVSVTILSGWMFVVNLPFEDRGWEPWVLVWILASGLVGAIGGIAYLLSIDGGRRFRTRVYRVGGWLAMLVAVALPTNLTYMLVPLVLVLLPSLFGPSRGEEEPEEAVTSS